MQIAKKFLIDHLANVSICTKCTNMLENNHGSNLQLTEKPNFFKDNIKILIFGELQ